MPIKDPEQRKAAQKKAMDKLRGVNPAVNPDNVNPIVNPDDPTPAEYLATFCQPGGRTCPSRCYILHRTVLADPGPSREWSVMAMAEK